ncbi:protein SINE3 [Gastrolobium bilobum]|uniref:protein SINE3 n=1 Tax=Gastrolobium bilobum TaxID=150636 RepID=UPI002AB1386A|nr:protein SINE3 [Gastrolobium bilobum]
MKENQTPNKVFARSADNRNGRFKDFPSKKSIKIANKSLNAAFTSVSEDSVDLSPISEISDVNRSEDVTSFLLEEPTSLDLLPSYITPPKKISDTTGISSTNCFGTNELDSSKFASVEAEIAVNFLRNVKPELLNSVNAAPQYRKLMDEIIEYVIQDFHTNTLPEEGDNFAQVLSEKNRMLFLCIFIWIVGVSVVIFFTSDIHTTYCGPMPT